MSEAILLPAYDAVSESGLIAFATLLALHRIAVDPAQLRHGLGHHEAVDQRDLVRIAHRLDGVKARVRTAQWTDLDRLPLPALTNCDGGRFLIARVAGEEESVQRPDPTIEKLTREQLEGIQSGEMVLVDTRENIGLVGRAFDFSRFIPQIVRYGSLIGEVLLAQNLLGFAAPFFFQNLVGSGKSMLTELLQRLYTPPGRRVLVDDADVAEIDPAWLRGQIGVAPEDNLLFNQLMRENTALSNLTMPPEAVTAAATLAGAHEFIVRLPQGYDTMIAERGANLSGGNRQ